MLRPRPGQSQISRQQYQQHTAAEQELVRSLPEYEIPIADSLYTAPGYRMLNETFYCYKDVARPWDPAVIRAIREFEPTAMPITIRTTWQHMNRGNPQEPFTLIRHGIARCVRDALLPTHRFRCELPIHHEPSLFSSFPNIYTRVAPNYVEVNHYDREVRPYGYDVPGAYLPFNWDFYAMLYRDYENNRRWQDIASDLLDPQEEHEQQQIAADQEYDSYVAGEISKYWNEPASDLEWKNAMLAGPKQPETPTMVQVPEQALTSEPAVVSSVV